VSVWEGIGQDGNAPSTVFSSSTTLTSRGVESDEFDLCVYGVRGSARRRIRRSVRVHLRSVSRCGNRSRGGRRRKRGVETNLVLPHHLTSLFLLVCYTGLFNRHTRTPTAPTASSSGFRQVRVFPPPRRQQQEPGHEPSLENGRDCQGSVAGRVEGRLEE
jgi:hypothetical protein